MSRPASPANTNSALNVAAANNSPYPSPSPSAALLNNEATRLEEEIYRQQANQAAQQAQAQAQANQQYNELPHEELVRLRKEQEDIQRREYLEKAKQWVLIAKEKEDAFWNAQEDKYKSMVKRCDIAEHTCQDVYQVLKSRSKAFSYTYTALAKDTQSFASNERGSLREAAIGFELLRKTSVEEFQQLKERVFEQTVENASELTNEISKRKSFLESQGSSVIKEVHSARNKAWEAWSAYERTATDAIKASQLSQPAPKDPIICGRIYRAKLEEVKTMHNTYGEKMSRLFQDLKVADGRRIDASKAVLLDHLLAEKQLLQTQLKLVEQSISAVKSCDREKDVSEWVAEGQFVVNDQGATVFDILPPNQDKKVLISLINRDVAREGILYRQGKYIKSNWKEITVLLTRSGYFHYFDDAKDAEPSFSLYLGDVSITLAPELGDSVMVFSQPNNNFFSLTGSPNLFYFKAKNVEDMVDWMVALKQFTLQPAAVAAPERRASQVSRKSSVVTPPASAVASAASASQPPPPSTPPPAEVLAEVEAARAAAALAATAPAPPAPASPAPDASPSA